MELKLCLLAVFSPYPVVLVGGDSNKLGLREGEGAEVLVGVQVAVWSGFHVDDVEPGLVAMHGVEDHLGGKNMRERPCVTPTRHIKCCIINQTASMSTV